MHESILGRTHQLLFYADYVHVLGGAKHAVKKNAEALVVARKETGLDVSADKLITRSYLEIRMQDEVTL